MNLVEKLQDLFERNGIFVDEDEFDDELQIVSLQFLSLLIAIEDEFSVELDEEHYSNNRIKTFRDFVNAIETVLNKE